MQAITDPKTNSRPRTLTEAKARLAELQRAATKLGIQLPTAAPPKTLDSSRRLITDIERRLNLDGATASTIPVTPVKGTPPAPPNGSAGVESITAKARAFLAKPVAPKSSRPAASTTNQPLNPQDMGKRELETAIGAEKNAEKRWALFQELRARERGKPTRAIAEIGETATRSELERMIQNERNPERRAMLFGELRRREEYSKKH